MSEDLRYPIGDFDSNVEINSETRKNFIRTIEDLPEKIRTSVDKLSDDQLDTPYRPEGWTVRQLVHHIADSHLNAYCRFKLALTEEFPTIRPYYEDRWAILADSKLPIEDSLKIIEGVHTRWAAILSSMTDEDFQRKLNHPESGEWSLEKFLALYNWHSKHHAAHITSLCERKGWM